MGFKVQRTVFNIRFAEGSRFDGLFVQAKSISMGEVMRLSPEADKAREGSGVAEVQRLITRFSEELVEWDLEDEDGTPTPPTLEGLLSHDPNVVLPIVLAWFDAMLQVDDDLGKDSNSGERFPEASIPMETK
jgi:hypothetical protein